MRKALCSQLYNVHSIHGQPVVYPLGMYVCSRRLHQHGAASFCLIWHIWLCILARYSALCTGDLSLYSFLLFREDLALSGCVLSTALMAHAWSAFNCCIHFPLMAFSTSLCMTSRKCLLSLVVVMPVVSSIPFQFALSYTLQTAAQSATRCSVVMAPCESLFLLLGIEPSLMRARTSGMRTSRQ